MQAMELATTLRIPLGEPMLAGGMTYLAPAGNTPAPVDATAPPTARAPVDVEQRQLYLVLEIH
jgi:hypothetical protein